MAHDNIPANSGSINIAINLLSTSTIYNWPLFPASTTSPEMHLLIRERSDGEVFMWVNETWPPSPFQDQ